jgi:transposase
MLSIARTTRVFLATEPTDMRKGFDGLFALVETVIQEDPFSGHLFVFRNQRRDRLKVLWWDRDGLAIFYKRLERGSYQFPTDSTVRKLGGPTKPEDRGHAARCEIRADELALLLEGIDLGSVKRRPRYQRPVTATTPPVTTPTPSV